MVMTQVSRISTNDGEDWLARTALLTSAIASLRDYRAEGVSRKENGTALWSRTDDNYPVFKGPATL